MTTVEIHDVTDDKKGRADFVSFPFDHYKSDPNWISMPRIDRNSFISGKNPFFLNGKARLFVAYTDGRPVGRISAQVDGAYNTYHNASQGFFGFYESINDQKVCASLLAVAEKWLSAEGMQGVIGPASFSFNDELGFLSEGFEDPPSLMMPYTKSYYPALFKNQGYEVTKKLYSYRFSRDSVDETALRLQRLSRQVLKRLGGQVQLRIPTKATLDDDITHIVNIYNDAWADHWGFSPFPREALAEFVKGTHWFIPHESVALVELNGVPVGVIVLLPDLYQALRRVRNGKLFPLGWLRAVRDFWRINRGRIVIMGVKKEAQEQGIEILLYKHTIDTALAHPKYGELEVGWILEDNLQMNAALEHLGAIRSKQYIVLQKALP